MHPLLLVALTLPAAAPPFVAQRPLHPPLRAPAPVLPDPSRFDADGDKLDDALLGRFERAAPRQRLRLEWVFKAPVTQQQLDDFTRAGGELVWVYQAVSHGFVGTIGQQQLRGAVKALGEGLVLVKGDEPMGHDLDKATRNARARPVWAAGFNGPDAGFLGSPTTTVAVIDTGIDDTHPDLAGRMAYWRDFDGTSPTPLDVFGHGTCVTSIAVGSGAAFEASKPALKWTKSWWSAGTIAGNVVSRQPLSFELSPVHVSATAVFDGLNPTRFALSSRVLGLSPYDSVTFAVGPSPLTLMADVTVEDNTVYSVNISQADGGTVTWATASATATPYFQNPDGLPTFRGMAPEARWGMARAADEALSVSMALDDLMANRQAINLKVINLSQSPTGDGGTLLPDKVRTVTNGGVLLIKTAGNTGRSGADPFITALGNVGEVLTVGSTTSGNQLTEYTSTGPSTFDAGEDLKPDLLAPGGSPLVVNMLCADSNTADSEDGGADLVADDYTTDEGTSFSAPLVAGASALVIQALESKGLVWDWNSSAHPLLVKSILLSSATETNLPRERPPSPNPTVGRGAALKDRAEGYGLLNVDAALESLVVDLGATADGGTAGGPYDKRAWGYRVALDAGASVAVALLPSLSADFDVYLFAEQPNRYGNPVLLAAADRVGPGKLERLRYTADAGQVARLYVKRISGAGSWSLIPLPVCGDSTPQLGEECDDGNATANDCCTSCLADPSTQRCPVGSCDQGFCVPPPCGDRMLSFPETCDDGNTFGNDCCSAQCQIDADGTACSKGLCANGRCLEKVTSPAIPGGVVSQPAGSGCSGCASADGLVISAALTLLAARRRRNRKAPCLLSS